MSASVPVTMPWCIDIHQLCWSQSCKTTMPKNKILGKNTIKPALHPCTHSIYRHECECMQQLTTMQHKRFQIIDLLSVLYLCSPGNLPQVTVSSNDRLIYWGLRCQFNLYSLQTNCDSNIQKPYLAPTQIYPPGVIVMVHTVCLLVLVYDM